MLGNRFAPAPRFAMSPEDRNGASAAAPVGNAPANSTSTEDLPASGKPAGTPANDAAPRPPDAVPAAEASPKALPDKTSPDKAFPDSWRQDLAAGDKAFLKTLDRFQSPAALAKAYKELTAKLSSGELRATRGPGTNATPEQVAAWRAEHGLPENAAAYVDGLALANGDVTGEAEKPLLASFAEQAMKGHWTGAQYNQAVGWFLSMQDQIAAQRQHADAEFKQQATSDLMREWRADYAANRNAVGQFFDKNFPLAFKSELLGARLPDGTMLANHPAFNKAILEVAKTIDPRGSMLPNAAGASLSNVESRIAEIEGKHMRAAHGSDTWKMYWSGESGTRMQQEYRGLLAAREQARRG